jgi:hypothetical protein
LFETYHFPFPFTGRDPAGWVNQGPLLRELFCAILPLPWACFLRNFAGSRWFAFRAPRAIEYDRLVY